MKNKAIKKSFQKVKRQHNIYLSDEGDNISKIVIKGNNLNLRWFNKSIIIWSGEKDLPVKILELVDKGIEGGKHGTNR